MQRKINICRSQQYFSLSGPENHCRFSLSARSFRTNISVRNQIFGELPRRIQHELAKYPFTWEGRSWQCVPKEPDGTYHPLIFRRKLQSYLRLGTPVLDDFIEFVRQYPQHARWLRDNLEEHLWLQLKPYCNLTDTETRDTNARGAIGGNTQ